MGSKSDAWEAEVLRLVTGQAPTISGGLSVSTAIVPWIALFTTTPSDNTAGVEVSATGTAYARVNSATKWGPASGSGPGGSTISNNATIAFITAGATGWGNIKGFGIMTSGTYGSGNLLMWGDLTTAKDVLSGDTPSFASGALILTED